MELKKDDSDGDEVAMDIQVTSLNDQIPGPHPLLTHQVCFALNEICIE